MRSQRTCGVMHPSTHAALALLLLSAQPVQAQAPLSPGFVDAAAVVDGLIVDMRYFGANNFVGERIDGYERPRCLLSEPAAHALAAVERDLSARGLGLKVFDCYRPQRAVAQFVRWAQRLDRRSHAGAARGRARARYGLAVRLLQPEVMAVGSERQRSGAAEPRAARRRVASRRLSALRQGVVALHAQQRAVPGYVFRFPGEVSCATRCLAE